MVFLSKNKKHRFALAYYLDENTFNIDENTSSWGYNLGIGEVRLGTRKVIFKNNSYSETVFFF